ncbi:MAG: hypothetical protein ACRDDW_06535 [Candidatus Rhabdochlamydia sp.]
MRIEKENPAFIDSRKNASNKEQDCEVFDLDCKESTIVHKYKNQPYYTATGCATCGQTCVSCYC